MVLDMLRTRNSKKMIGTTIAHWRCPLAHSAFSCAVPNGRHMPNYARWESWWGSGGREQAAAAAAAQRQQQWHQSKTRPSRALSWRPTPTRGCEV